VRRQLFDTLGARGTTVEARVSSTVTRSVDRTEESALNASPAAQLRLLDIQSLDSRLDQLAHRRQNLPEFAELTRIGDRLAELHRLIVAAETKQSDIRRQQSKAEGDVDQVRARADRDQRRLDSGRVGSPRELENLQSEIASLGRRQSDLEDTVLEIMERQETVEMEIAGLAKERDELTAARDAAQARRDAALAELDAEIATATEERASAAVEVPEELLALYVKLRGQMGGVGAAALSQRRCEGCRLELNTIEINRIRTAPPDEVLRCEECRRILVRTPESGL
jgi:predicted  nucleic acid-binding Zn-ribbon protein